MVMRGYCVECYFLIISHPPRYSLYIFTDCDVTCDVVARAAAAESGTSVAEMRSASFPRCVACSRPADIVAGTPSPAVGHVMKQPAAAAGALPVVPTPRRPQVESINQSSLLCVSVGDTSHLQAPSLPVYVSISTVMTQLHNGGAVI